jgi:hypothetical protein
MNKGGWGVFVAINEVDLSQFCCEREEPCSLLYVVFIVERTV